MNRKIMASLLVIGVVGAVAGGSTFALFNDTETSDTNTFEAGALDLKIDWVESYNGEVVENQTLTDNPGSMFDITDVKPGDVGEANVSLHVYDNPAHVWMEVDQTANLENGCTEPEAEVDDSCADPGEGQGELGEHLHFTVYDTDDDMIFNGTAEELDGMETYLGQLNNSTTEWVRVEWWVPRETGNVIQTDSKHFNFTFYAEQARHNPVNQTPDNETENPDNETEIPDDNKTQEPDNETEADCPNDMKWCPPEEEDELGDYYQVDLYSGEVVEDRGAIDRISSNETERELEQYIHGNVNESITDDVTPGQVDCIVDESNEVALEDGEATFNFTVEGECDAENATVASYHKPYSGYDFERRGEQELLDYQTFELEEGDYSISVEVPE